MILTTVVVSVRSKSRSSEQCNQLEETTSNNLTSNSSRLHMSFGNMNIPRKDDMDREDEEENIYANVDPINDSDVRTETENSQTPQHTGTEINLIITHTHTHTHLSHTSN